MNGPVLEAVSLTLDYHMSNGTKTRAVDDVSIEIGQGSSVGLIGESGSGKSSIARLLLGLEAPTHGQIRYLGTDLTGTRRRKNARHLRMGAVYQEPFESLDPTMTVAKIIAEPLKLAPVKLSSAARADKVSEALSLVSLPETVAGRHPVALSGGQQQRVGIARALVTKPSLVILDEPTSSLDVSTRAQILNLLKDLGTELDIAYLLISHDLPTVAYVCDQIYVLNRGRVVEHGSTSAVTNDPQHPYTRALLGAAITLDETSESPSGEPEDSRPVAKEVAPPTGRSVPT